MRRAQFHRHPAHFADGPLKQWHDRIVTPISRAGLAVGGLQRQLDRRKRLREPFVQLNGQTPAFCFLGLQQVRRQPCEGCTALADGLLLDRKDPGRSTNEEEHRAPQQRQNHGADSENPELGLLGLMDQVVDVGVHLRAPP